MKASHGAVILLHCIAVSKALNTALERSAMGVEIGQDAQIMMRQDNHKKKEVSHSNSAHSNNRPVHKAPAEATEAFAKPSKIDDSLFAGSSLRMPSFIEHEPWFYSSTFVAMALLFMGGVCIYVQHEDYKELEKREFIRDVRMRASLAASGRKQMSAGLLPGKLQHYSSSPPAQATPADLRAAAAAALEAAKARGSDEPQLAPAARAAQAMAAAEDRMVALSNAVGNITGMLAGENVKPPAWSSTDATTTSGASTPRSQFSQYSSSGSRSSGSKLPGIRNGTVMIVRMPEVIFASTRSWQEIGQLTEGQRVVAAGPAEKVDDYSMVPIKPRGAVDLKTLEVVCDRDR